MNTLDDLRECVNVDASPLHESVFLSGCNETSGNAPVSLVKVKKHRKAEMKDEMSLPV